MSDLEEKEKEDDKWDDFIFRQLKTLSDSEYEHQDDSENQDEAAWDKLSELGSAYEAFEISGDTEEYDDLLNRFGLPIDLPRKNLQRLIAKQKRNERKWESPAQLPVDEERAARQAHGRRGKAPRDKHELGEPPVPLFDWKAHRPENWSDKLDEDVEKNGGEAAQNYKTFEAEMDTIADFARLERRTFKNNGELISYGKKRKDVFSSFDAERLRNVFA